MKLYDGGASILLGLALVAVSLGASEAIKPKPCNKVLIQHEDVAGGVLETRTCRE